MLSELIQLKVIKSHPILPKVILTKAENPKFSLQLSRNKPFGQVQDPQQLIPKKIVKNSIHAQSKQISRNSSKNSLKYSKKPINSTEEYFAPRERTINQKKIGIKLQNIGNLIPLIVSPKKLHSLGKEGLSSFVPKHPLISSSKNKLLRMKSQQKNSFQQKSLMQSSLFRSSLTKTSLIKSMQETIFHRNQSAAQQEQHGSKKYLLKSASYQNLSPLKQKLYKITNRSNDLTLNREQKQFQSSKRNLQRSDSFKRAIEQSRQKGRFIDSEKENKAKMLNTQYYVRENVKNTEQNPKNCRNPFNLVQKLIKNPARKPPCGLQSPEALNIENSILLRKKTDSFINESVNNSNMFSIQGQNSNILTMDPY